MQTPAREPPFDFIKKSQAAKQKEISQQEILRRIERSAMLISDSIIAQKLQKSSSKIILPVKKQTPQKRGLFFVFGGQNDNYVKNRIISNMQRATPPNIAENIVIIAMIVKGCL